MKTGGTFNFLKRAGVIFMLLAIFASSCNKYADDFTQINTKLDALATQVAGVTTLTTDISALKSQITALQTSIAGLPSASTQAGQFAAVSTALTAMDAKITALTTTLNTVATSGTATKAVVDGLKTDLAALATTVATNNTAAVAAATAAMAKMNTNETAVAALKTQLTAMAAADALVAADITAINAGVAVNTAGIAANAAALTAQAAQITALAADLTTLAAASGAADAANAAAAAAAAATAAAQSTSLADISTALAALATSEDGSNAATAAAIAALQVSVDAQQLSLDQILANTNPIPSTFVSATPNGTSVLVSTTALTLTFDVDPANLSASLITVVGADKGVLSGTGVTRTLAISNITVADKDSVTVTLANPSGYTITPLTRKSKVYVAPPVAFTGVTADGISTVLTSSLLTLTFDVDPTTLTAANITLTGATKGALTGTGLTRTLAISGITVANGANVTVAIASPSGFNITPATKTVAVNVANVASVFTSITANGTTGAVSTTALTLNFGGGPLTTSFTASNITVVGATKGALTGTGNTRTLAISDITVLNGSNVTVSVTSPAGFSITPAAINVPVWVGATPVVFSDLTANGTSLLVNTTALTLTFSSDPTTLTAADITVAGATKGALTGTGLTRTLAVSALTVLDQANLTVTLTNPAGYVISPASKVVKANRVPTAVALTLATNGTAGTVATTLLTATVSGGADIGLVAGDFTITGATVGAFTNVGLGVYTFAVSAITAANLTVTVVNPVGFAVVPGTSTVATKRITLLTPVAGVTTPVAGAAPDLTFNAGTGYVTGAVAWSGTLSGGNFVSGNVYTATLTMVPSADYTTTGIVANSIGLGFGVSTNPVDSGVITTVFTCP